jgi:predicted MFS family arabinose efflux permease
MGLFADIRASRAPALAFVAMGMVWAAFAAQVPVLKDQIGASDAAFGGIFLVASLGAVASMWLAPIVDRTFGAVSVQISSALLAISFVLPGFSYSTLSFAVIFLIVSATSGVSDILMNARISEIEGVTRRALMNLNHAIFSFAYAGTAVLTGLAREAGFGPIPVFGVVCVIILIMCLAMRAPHRSLAGGTSTVRPVTRGIVWIGGLVVLAAFFTEQATEGWSALHIERTLGGGAAQGALGPAVLGLTMGFGRLFGHGIAAHVRDTTMIAGACLISALGMVLAAVAPTAILAYLGFGISGLGISVVVPLAMAIVGRLVPETDRVQAIGRASVIGYAAFMFGPPMMGIVSQALSLRAAFGMVACVLVAAAVALVPLMARRIASAQ